jgi:hypothetical protein
MPNAFGENHEIVSGGIIVAIKTKVSVEEETVLGQSLIQ